MTKIKTYRQDRPADYLKAHPTERWRCDIYPDDGSDHHGVGPTEASALSNAALHWEAYSKRPQPRFDFENACPECGPTCEC